jgi:hypothetical protein
VEGQGTRRGSIGKGEEAGGGRGERGGRIRGKTEKAHVWSKVTCLCLPRQSLPVSPLL